MLLLEQGAGGDSVICLPLTIDMKIFCLERLSQVVCGNVGRRQHIWRAVTEHFGGLMSWKGDIPSMDMDHDDEQRRHSQYLLERVTVCMFSLCRQLSAMEDILTVLAVLNEVEDDTMSVIGRRLIAGIKMLLNGNGPSHGDGDEMWWKMVLSVIKRFASLPLSEDKTSCLEAFHLMEVIAKHHLVASNLLSVQSVLCLFGNHSVSAPVHNTRVIELILSIHSRLGAVSGGNEAVLGPMWLKTLSNISTFAANSDYQTSLVFICIFGEMQSVVTCAIM